MAITKQDRPIESFSKENRPAYTKGGKYGFGFGRFGTARFDQAGGVVKQDRPASSFSKENIPSLSFSKEDIPVPSFSKQDRP